MPRHAVTDVAVSSRIKKPDWGSAIKRPLKDDERDDTRDLYILGDMQRRPEQRRQRSSTIAWLQSQQRAGAAERCLAVLSKHRLVLVTPAWSAAPIHHPFSTRL